MREADFSERIKTILCERVGGRCSNPNCRRETLGPHREGDKRLSMGEAAHILGASPKGARYDARMTKEERESINNGIWLCSACHTLIDKNPDEYPVEELLKWKMIAEYEQERRLKGEDIVSFQSQQMERKKEALKQVKYATDCFHDLLEYSYKYWKMNFAQSFSNPIDLQNEIDDHHFMYEEELLHINKYLEKRDDLYEALNQHSLDLGKQVVELLNEYINLTLENIDEEHICCAIGDKKHQAGVDSKKEWIKSKLKDGHIFRKLNARGKIFIEYEPIETAWIPISGKNYEYIYCLWVAGSFKGKGIGKELIEYAINDSKEKGKSGICTLVSKKKKPFIGEKKFFEHYGFKVVDSIADYELLALQFEDGETPKFNDNARTMKIDNQDFTIYYSNECPYVEYEVNELTEYAKENNIKINFIKIDSLEKAKNAPCIFNNWANFYKGKFISNTILNANSFKKLID